MVLVAWCSQMVKNMKAIVQMGRNMDLGSIHMIMEKRILDHGIVMFKRELEGCFGKRIFIMLDILIILLDQGMER